MLSNPIFTVRPLIKPEELLSSYLFRLAAANYVEIADVIANLKTVSQLNRTNIHLVDIYPSLTLDMKKITSLTLLTEDNIEEMSFAPLLKKFYTRDDIKSYQSLSIIKKCLITSKRRFCSQCLKEGSGYKHFWQIAELEICDIHLTKLATGCIFCDKDESYMKDNDEQYFKCTIGVHDLRDQIKVVDISDVDNSHYLVDQLQKYDDWKFLTDKSSLIINEIDGLNMDQSLLTTLLYVYQYDTSTLSKSNHILTYPQYSEFRRMINTPQARHKISMERLLRIIRNAGISVREFSNIKVPKDFIHSLKVSFSRPDKVCLAIWCNSYKTNNTICIVHNNKRITVDKIVYNNHSVCTECWMRYGFDAEDKLWKPVDNMIELIEKIKSLLEAGLSKMKICNELGISKPSIAKVLGYMSQHKLLTAYQENKYVSGITEYDGELVECFQQLFDYETKNGLATSSNKILGWNLQTYYYYLANPLVQKYKVFDAHLDREVSKITTLRLKKYDELKLSKLLEDTIQQFISQDRTISTKAIKEVTGVSIRTFHLYGLGHRFNESIQEQRSLRRRAQEDCYWIEADEFIRLKEVGNQITSIKEVAHSLGLIGTNWMYGFPELYERISTRVKALVDRVKSDQIKKYKIQIDKLFQSNNKISNEIIAEYIGVTYKNIFASYPELFHHIKLLRYK